MTRTLFGTSGLAIPVVLLAGLLGCGEGTTTIEPGPTDPAAIEVELAEVAATLDHNVGGCGDVFVYTFDDDQTRRITFSIQGELAEAARASEDALVQTFELPHPDVTVTAAWGDTLVHELCNDVIEPDTRPQIDGEASAIEGTLVLTITPELLEDGPLWLFADLELSDVTFEHAATGAQHTVDDAMVEDVSVGWYPG